MLSSAMGGSSSVPDAPVKSYIVVPEPREEEKASLREDKEFFETRKQELNRQKRKKKT